MTDKTNGTEYLAFVQDKLKSRILELSREIAAGQKDIEGMHEYYWENYTEMDQYGYENYDNQQALFHQMHANEQQMHLRRRFRKMLDSPFFGRVDFRFEGDEESEIFYIGIGNFAESAGGVPLVYDWRAPVSGLFYDFDRGEAYYEAPLGRMDGEITAKWQYKIRRGKMIYQFESDIKVDDEILMAELGSNGTVALKNIVSTIQREQNAIIRNTKDRVLVIQGAAGSGKTSIALHRIAYLLYRDRKNLKSSNILILSPNGVFSDYISHVLPELGEENIQEMSFDLFAYKELKDTAADCEDRYDQVEKCLRFPELPSKYKEKQSGKFMQLLERYIMQLEDELMDFRDVSFAGFCKKEEEIIQLFYFKFPDIPLLARMDAVCEYFTDEIETLRGRDFSDEEREALREKFLALYDTRDLYVLYSRFLKRNGFAPLKHLPIEKRKLLYEDVYPVLYLKYRLLGARENSSIKHLVVDEMQDYSRLQYQILKRIFTCKMTILGDRAQTMEGEQQDVLEFLPGILGKDIRRIVMNKSYRNTVEIASYANHLAGITDMELLQRHGKPVEERQFAEMGEACAEVLRCLQLGEEAYETAAVIFRTEKEAEQGAAVLKRALEEQGFDTKERFNYLHRDSSRFLKGLTVTTFYLAKGLEFDQVFLIFPKEDQTPLAVQGRYIAATRALHELYVYDYHA